MTRSSKLALVTLLAGLLSLASAGTVNAGTTCTGWAQEHCTQMAAADDAILFHAQVAPISVHLLSSRGIGQENFEAMDAGQVTVFSVGTPGSVATHLPGYAPEHYEEIMTASAATN